MVYLTFGVFLYYTPKSEPKSYNEMGDSILLKSKSSYRFFISWIWESNTEHTWNRNIFFYFNIAVLHKNIHKNYVMEIDFYYFIQSKNRTYIEQNNFFTLILQYHIKIYINNNCVLEIDFYYFILLSRLLESSTEYM